MKLIVEEAAQVRFIKEEVKGQKKPILCIEGIFLMGEIKNRNGRIYPINILEREVARYNEEYVTKNRAWGELGHPDGPTLNMERACIRTIGLKKDGNNYIGKARIIEGHPYGQMLKAIIEDGGVPGVSSRGMGSLQEKNGESYVAEDFYLAVAADVVADPSAPNAFVNGIMEGKEWVLMGGAIKPMQIEQSIKAIKKAPSRKLIETQIREFSKFLKSI